MEIVERCWWVSAAVRMLSEFSGDGLRISKKKHAREGVLSGGNEEGKKCAAVRVFHVSPEELL